MTDPAIDALATLEALHDEYEAARDFYLGKHIWTRRLDDEAQIRGEITGVSRCRLDGCTGLRLHVKWPDNHRTYPCSKGCHERSDGDFEIG